MIGVGMRKTTLLLPPGPVTGLPAGRKLGWVRLQVPASVRPVITNRSCTPPSGAPLDCTKRASRTGPLGAMNHGIWLVAPAALATSNSGFAGGLEPPAYGCW